MPKHGRKFSEADAKVERRLHTLEEAVQAAKTLKWAAFDESLDVAVVLGVDPRHADQMVRATVLLPHGTGKSMRVLVFAQGEKIKEAEAAGADHVGGAELSQKILEGWMDFDAVVATPDMMREVGKLGRVLGPRGLMPNPKTGTVTPDAAKAVGEFKGGKVEYRTDRNANVHVPIGKASFDAAALEANYNAVMDEIVRAKPSGAKGAYVRKVTLSSTMGPGVRVDAGRLDAD
jgi:large subunit ribosomal protein L1